MRFSLRTIACSSCIVVLAMNLGGVWTASAGARGTLSFEARVASRRAVEEVLWRHRIWPTENPSPKPPLEKVLSEETLESRVEDDLAKSAALERLWQRPIQTDQLQAEISRMAASSQDPDVLREIFAALGNDPALIAETLARPALADRELRDWYAFDPRFHEDVRREAEAAVRGMTSASELRRAPDYGEVVYVSDDDHGRHDGKEVRLAATEWRDTVEELSRASGAATLSPLEETRDGFRVRSILEADATRIRVATARWAKKPFETWWQEQDRRLELPAFDAAGGYTLPDVATSACTPDSWRPIKTDHVQAKSQHVAVWTGTEMIVFGSSPGGARYNPATDTWSSLSSVNQPPGLSFSGVWTGTEMIVWETFQMVGGRYDPATDTWQPISTGPNAPTQRTGPTAVWTGSEMIVWGGRRGWALNTGARYNLSTNSWSSVSTANAPSARDKHTAVWTGSEMIVWGGVGFTGGYLNDGARYAPSTDTWITTATSALATARGGHSAIWTGSRMIVWGGAFGPYDYVNTGASYDPLASQWSSIAVSSIPGRKGHVAVWTGTEMIVWGGENTNPNLGDGARYSPQNNSWTTLPTGALARRYHTGVWTGSELIVWGGEYNNNALYTGARFSPSAGSWVPLSPGGTAPPGGGTIVWTGAEMVAWGGRLDGFTYRGGGRYVPATDTWTPTSQAAGAPSARVGQTAVWTGTDMIVWGGVEPSNPPFGVYLSSGSRYSPTTDGWTAIGGGLSGRIGHTAVWTGTEMIVFGGESWYMNQYGAYHSLYSDAARFNPATSSWQHVPDAPLQGRSQASAVWTGTEMIVWGGGNTDPQYYLAYQNGARYNPASGVWTPTSLGVNVPSPRYGHSAVWSGSEMIVWGGSSGGARYHPDTDTWTPMSYAPPASYGPATVWTGSQMIVSGGSSGGARYDPFTDTWLPMSTAGAPTIYDGLGAWTGSEMIYWNGTGGRYCSPCPAWYQDQDGDGYGSGAGIDSCTPVAGSARAAGDCDDAQTAVHPGAIEACNGIDDDCNAITDDAQPPAGHPLLAATGPGASMTLSWQAVSGATGYDVVRGDLTLLLAGGGDYAAASGACAGNDVAGTSVVDASDPGAGAGVFYLVRAVNCGGAGSYDSGGARQVGSRDPGIAASAAPCP